jgi:hypothetical protein
MAPRTRLLLGILVIVLVIFLFRVGFFDLPTGISMGPGMMGPWYQQAHVLGLRMNSYAGDHDGKYPDGKSSMEIFQKLLDGGYADDPAIFYIPSPGKIKPVAGRPLRAENVCWDITGIREANSPVKVPLVFMTGYKVNYSPGGAAVPLVKPYPQFGLKVRGRAAPVRFPQFGVRIAASRWREWFNLPEEIRYGVPAIAVFYTTGQGEILELSGDAATYGAVLNFVPTDFNANGRVYRQLTPDGILPNN